MPSHRTTDSRLTVWSHINPCVLESKTQSRSSTPCQGSKVRIYCNIPIELETSKDYLKILQHIKHYNEACLDCFWFSVLS